MSDSKEKRIFVKKFDQKAFFHTIAPDFAYQKMPIEADSYKEVILIFSEEFVPEIKTRILERRLEEFRSMGLDPETFLFQDFTNPLGVVDLVLEVGWEELFDSKSGKLLLIPLYEQYLREKILQKETGIPFQEDENGVIESLGMDRKTLFQALIFLSKPFATVLDSFTQSINELLQRGSNCTPEELTQLKDAYVHAMACINHSSLEQGFCKRLIGELNLGIENIRRTILTRVQEILVS